MAAEESQAPADVERSALSAEFKDRDILEAGKLEDNGVWPLWCVTWRVASSACFRICGGAQPSAAPSAFRKRTVRNLTQYHLERLRRRAEASGDSGLFLSTRGPQSGEAA
jgi:hypothetical protein